MRVGVDARLLAEPVTGIGRYTVEMLSALAGQAADFRIYAPKPVVTGQWDRPNQQIRSAAFQHRIGKMLWSQTLLPWWAARDRVDVFWGTTHRLPRWLPADIARVVTIHDMVWKYAGDTMRPLSRLVEQRLMPEALRLADRVVADSHSTAAALEAEYPWLAGRLRVVHLGISALAAPDRQILQEFRIDRPYVLFVGTLEPRKNLRRLLQAFARLPEAVRAGNLLVIAGGRGWGKENVEALVEQLGLQDCVRQTGYVSDAGLSALYAQARCLAMPSLYEGFGLPLLEAMSFGVPVLTSSSSSLPEVAGDAGLLVDPLDVDSISRGLASPQAREGSAAFFDFAAGLAFSSSSVRVNIGRSSRGSLS